MLCYAAVIVVVTVVVDDDDDDDDDDDVVVWRWLTYVQCRQSGLESVLYCKYIFI